jgi:hypothetical protein
MKIKKKIGWQKYEDIIEAHMDSPLLDALFQKMQPSSLDEEDMLDILEKDDLESLGQFQQQIMIPIDNKLIENITMAQNFDCWMGHTNFNITKDIKDKLNRTEGVELLKICSRYRFFIGVGRMFDFKDVRKTIEDLFLE